MLRWHPVGYMICCLKIGVVHCKNCYRLLVVACVTCTDVFAFTLLPSFFVSYEHCRVHHIMHCIYHAACWSISVHGLFDSRTLVFVYWKLEWLCDSSKTFPNTFHAHLFWLSTSTRTLKFCDADGHVDF